MYGMINYLFDVLKIFLHLLNAGIVGDIGEC